jgi:hypothetical protein
MLREAQKDMKATEKEVAVMMMLPFVQFLDMSTRGVVYELVNSWAHRGFVRGTVHLQFKQVLFTAMP